MQIRIKINFGKYVKNVIYDVPDDEAKTYIDRGWAELPYEKAVRATPPVEIRTQAATVPTVRKPCGCRKDEAKNREVLIRRQAELQNRLAQMRKINGN